MQKSQTITAIKELLPETPEEFVENFQAQYGGMSEEEFIQWLNA